MPTLGLVIRTARPGGGPPDEADLGALCAQIGADPRIEIGEPVGVSIPIVVETKLAFEELAVIEALRRIDTVVGVDVAFASFEDLDDDAVRVRVSPERADPECLDDGQRETQGGHST